MGAVIYIYEQAAAIIVRAEDVLNTVPYPIIV